MYVHEGDESTSEKTTSVIYINIPKGHNHTVMAPLKRVFTVDRSKAPSTVSAQSGIQDNTLPSYEGIVDGG